MRRSLSRREWLTGCLALTSGAVAAGAADVVPGDRVESQGPDGRGPNRCRAARPHADARARARGFHRRRARSAPRATTPTPCSGARCPTCDARRRSGARRSSSARRHISGRDPRLLQAPGRSVRPQHPVEHRLLRRRTTTSICRRTRSPRARSSWPRAGFASASTGSTAPASSRRS